MADEQPTFQCQDLPLEEPGAWARGPRTEPVTEVGHCATYIFVEPKTKKAGIHASWS
jgi:hypothetical protein